METQKTNIPSSIPLSQKAMKLIDPYTGLMECKFCGARHIANVKQGGRYYRGSWQCHNQYCPSVIAKVESKYRRGIYR
jgi:hypothetical protein